VPACHGKHSFALACDIAWYQAALSVGREGDVFDHRHAALLRSNLCLSTVYERLALSCDRAFFVRHFGNLPPFIR